MGLFDKAKEIAGEAVNAASDVAIQKTDDIRQASLAKKEDKAALKAIASQFHETKRFGELSIDSGNKLLKIKHATTKIKKQGGAIGKATLAMMTGGISLAVEVAMKPSDYIVPFSDVRGYTVIQDDEEIQGGTIGAAAVGGLLLGVAGAFIGAAGGKRKIKKSVNMMALRVDLRNFDMPCAIVTYIGKPTKTKDSSYRKAVESMQEAMSCLDLIIEMNER